MTSQSKFDGGASKALLNARVLYFCYYLALGAFFPYINLYYERIGLTGVQIGTLSALPLVVTSTTALIWGVIADTLRIHRRMLSLSLLLVTIAVFGISQTSTFDLLVPLVLIYAVFSSPIVPLLDSAALDSIENHRGTYGGMRVWGTLGWMISTWLVGILIDELGILWLFYSYIALLSLTFFASLFQPARSQRMDSPLRHSLKQLVSRRTLQLFLLSVLLLAIAMGTVNYFFTLYMDGLGAQEGTIGLAWSLSALSEVPVMLLAGIIISRIGSNGLLQVAFITYTVRWFAYASIKSPAWVLPVQLLHGLSFAAFQVGGVTFINDRTPKGMRTTSQALFNTVSYGLGPIVGAMVGGYFYDTVGFVALFRVLSILTVIGLGVFLIANRIKEDS